MSRLLLVEDDRGLAAGLAAALRRDGSQVDVADCGREALRLARAASYDACILDLGLPDRDGVDVLREMRATAIGFPVLVLTARDALGERIRGLDAGADDYLVKPFELGELEARLRALLRRRASDATPWRQFGPLRFDAQAGAAFAGDDPVELTRREAAVLECLMRRPGRIVAKEAILAAAFPSDSEAAPNAVEVQVSRLRRKLEAAGVTVRALRGLGYRLEESGGHALE
ncbi:MAG: response regulator transcription factor [Betaproteobacteria bacterium]|nr:response regulator transcription factor [Betaproteobacteria bacterium]